MSCFAVSGCARFDFLLGSMSSVSPFQIQTPTAGTALVPSTTFTVTGVCDPLGGDVTLTGTSFTEGSVTGLCDPTLGTFSINVTSRSSGELLDIAGSQNDFEGNPQNSTVNNIMIHCAGAPMRACALNGSGNPSDPYSVGNISCLQEMRTGLTCHYELANNIDATATSTWNGGRGWEPVPNTSTTTIRFTGTLNGRNRTISNLFITPRFNNGTGLFSRLYDEGNGNRDEQVYDLNLVNPRFDLYDIQSEFGFIAGIADTVSLRNITISAANADFSINPSPSDPGAGRSHISMVVGQGTNISITNSNISGDMYFNNPTVTADPVFDKYEFIGGLVGFLTNGVLSDNNINVTMESPATNVNVMSRIGGAVGESSTSNLSQLNINVGFNLSANHAAGAAFSFIGGTTGRSLGAHTYSQICTNHSSSSFTTLAGMTDLVNGFIGDINGGTQNFNEISVKGNISFDAVSTLVTHGFGLNHGSLTVSNTVMDLNTNIVNGTPAAPWGGHDGFIELYSSGTFNNILLLSTSATPPAYASSTFSVAYTSDFSVSNSVVIANDDGRSPTDYGGAAFLASAPNGILESRAAIAGRPNADFVGYDFTNIWRRNTSTNLPELRFCN